MTALLCGKKNVKTDNTTNNVKTNGTERTRIICAYKWFIDFTLYQTNDDGRRRCRIANVFSVPFFSVSPWNAPTTAIDFVCFGHFWHCTLIFELSSFCVCARDNEDDDTISVSLSLSFSRCVCEIIHSVFNADSFIRVNQNR